MATKIDEIISDIIKVEGGYTNDKNDSGGETKYGVTIAVARQNGYTGPMKDMPEEFARKVYLNQYVVKPGFDKILALSESIAAELVDTGVNCGPGIAGKFLQRALNGFNNRGKSYPDVLVDGNVGQRSVDALAAYLKMRGKADGEVVMLKALNCLQGARYIDITEANNKNEDFTYGWIKNRC